MVTLVFLADDYWADGLYDYVACSYGESLIFVPFVVLPIFSFHKLLLPPLMWVVWWTLKSFALLSLLGLVEMSILLDLVYMFVIEEKRPGYLKYQIG